jgi:hypothetical protein
MGEALFLHLVLLVVLAACIHLAVMKSRTPQRFGQILLRYVLICYCGIPMLVLSIWALTRPDAAASYLGFPTGGPLMEFAAMAFLAMSILSLLTLWYRGTFVIAPAVLWAVFFTGATLIHLQDFHHKGVMTHGGVIHIFATHAFISILLVVGLLASGLLKQRT